MKFIEVPLQGICLIDVEPYQDRRGLFARTVCVDEFTAQGLSADFIQQSISFNPHAGTLRGMHWQEEPFAEVKLVRVTSGSIFDVVVDVRPESETYMSWFSVVLSSSNRRSIYIPKGFAHGFQTLEPDSEVLYEMTVAYKPEFSRSFRWDDPTIGIQWPETENRMVGDRDAESPMFSEY